MNVRVGVGAVVALGILATGGCGAVQAAKDEVAEAVVPTPKEKLVDSLPDSGAGPFHFAMKGGEQPMDGVLDASKKSYQLGFSNTDPDLGFTMTMKFLVVGEKSWIKIGFTGTEGLTGLPKLPKKWMLVDPAKIKDADGPLTYDDETDPGALTPILDAIVEVHETGAGKFAGTTDLTKQGEADLVDQKTLDALGAKANAVPFEAELDDKGRFAKAVIKVPAAGKIKAETYEVVYDKYGTAKSPAEPAAGEQQKATAAAYELLNS
ncbi:hypothetical protein [Winogradskya humida]|uniref:hypothetical protein n=1 Tax=Winogradskya humida TaxID=113566 RepID=UPI0019423DD5|nr:hypothetical protein [Actinoplanes humidus]